MHRRLLLLIALVAVPLSGVIDHGVIDAIVAEVERRHCASGHAAE